MATNADRRNRDYVPAVAGGLVLAGLAYGGSKIYRGIRTHNPLDTRNPKTPSNEEHILQMADMGTLENPANKLPITQFAGTTIPVGRAPFNELSYKIDSMRFIK